MMKLERWLYLDTHSGSWGDGLTGMRQLKCMKEEYPNSIVYVANHENVLRSNALMYVYEGLIDNVVSIPVDIVDDTEKLLCFLTKRFGNLLFDKVILGCIHDADIVQLLSMPIIRNATTYAICDTSILRYDVDVPINYPEDKMFYKAWSIQRSIDLLFQHINSDKQSIAIHPMSTRKHSAIHINGFEQIIKALCDSYNIIVLGTEVELYGKCLWDGKYIPTSHDIATLRSSPFMQTNKCYDFIGLSPLKQLEVMKRCHKTIISTTGAVVWSFLYDIPTICMAGGEWSTGHYQQFCESLGMIDSRCDRFPCDGNEPERMRYDKCIDVPLCLDSDINIEGLLKSL